MNPSKPLIRRSNLAATCGLAAALLAVPLQAQETAAQPAVSLDVPPPPAEGVVGPRELEGFSLPGTVTRPAESAATPAPTPPAPPVIAAPQQPRTTPPRPPLPAANATRPPSPLQQRPTLAVPDGSIAPPLPIDTGPTTPSAELDEADGGALDRWLYALAGLAVGLVVAFALWQRRGRTIAEARLSDMLDHVREAPLPTPPAPPPARPPNDGHVTTRPPASPRSAVPSPPPPPPATGSPAATGGIVSVRLRPWLELDLVADQLALNGDGALLQFACIVENSGSAPARDVRIEAALINSGERQEEEIAAFFRRPAAPESIPQIPPLSRMALKSTVDMPAKGIRAYQVEGRRLFVPLILFNAVYEWSGGSGHSAAAFLLGRARADAARMAPFRVDLGDQIYDGLSHRRHSTEVRD